MQVLKNKCIYSYYSTLLDMWVEWNSKLLMGEFPKGASTLNEALGEPTSDCRSRAKEMFRIGLVSTELTQGNTALQQIRLDKNVQSELGFIAAVIHKASNEYGRERFAKAESALCALFSVIQSVSWGNFEMSINSVAHRLLEAFPCPADINLITWLRYLLSGLFCPIASANSLEEVSNFTDFFEHRSDEITLSIIADHSYEKLYTMRNVDDVKKAIADRVSLTGIVQQKMALFILGTERDVIPRGFLSLAYLNYPDFLKYSYKVESDFWNQNPYSPLYDEATEQSGKYHVLQNLNKISELNCNLKEEYNKLMKDIYQGAKDALNLLRKPSDSQTDDPRQLIFFGAPGTGKSFRIEQITEEYKDDVIRTTFHPDSDYSTFVGCYKPTMLPSKAEKAIQPILDYDSLVDKFKEYLNVPNANITKACSLFGYHYHDSIVRMQEQGRRVMDLVNDAYKSNTTYDSVVRGGMACFEEGGLVAQTAESEIVYSFVPQAFTQAYTKAWKNQGKPIFLVIEELNRGNCAQIFGDIFQLLDRNDNNESSYSIIPDHDLQQHLSNEFKNNEAIPRDIRMGKAMRLPSNLYIWATMNTSDQSLFPIDSAFKRRWLWKYMPIANAELGYKIQVGELKFDWWNFVEKVNNDIESATKSEDKKLGYFFAKAENGIIGADTFVSKVVFYLWNDVFKDSYDKTIFKNDLTFHKFFQPNGDPKLDVVEQFLRNLNLKADGEE